MKAGAPRAVHPLAWWVWALGLGAAASRTTNPLLLALLVAVAWVVVAARRPEAPWARSFGSFAKLGGALVALRLVLQALFGARVPGHVLFTLPELTLADWLAGVNLGGPVTAESMLEALREGLQLATLLACVGAANSLASPYRLLRCLPAVLYELGVVVTVALSFAPHATASVARVREARRLRGRPATGLAGLRGMAVPVLEGALDRSLELAASMDSRGYGRRGTVPAAVRRRAQAAMLAGALMVCVGAYGLLDAGAPDGIGLPMAAAGAAALVAALALASRSSDRTRYRPDPWRAAEWATAAAGVVAFGGLTWAAARGLSGVRWPTAPLSFPTLPLVPALIVLAGALPALATPPLPAPEARR